MSDTNKLESYLYDTIALLKIEARKAKLNADDELSNSSYNNGYLMAYHTVISLMKNQATVFNIDEEKIGLAEIEPERDLL